MDKRKLAALIAAGTMSLASGAAALAANLGLVTFDQAGATPSLAVVSQVRAVDPPKVVTVYEDVIDPPAVSQAAEAREASPPAAVLAVPKRAEETRPTMALPAPPVAVAVAERHPA